MDDRVLQFRVGVLVLATALIAFFLVIYFGQLPFFARGEYVIHVEFREAPGVAVDTPVRKNGILIGRVDRVKLEDDRVLVSLGINASYRVRTNEVCRISTANLFGDAVLEFVKIEDFSQEPVFIPTNAFVQGEIAQDPLKVLMKLQGVVVNLEDDFEKALRAVAAASVRVETLAESLNTFIGTDGDEFRKLVGKSAQAMDSIDQAATTFNQLFSDEQLQGDLHRTLRELPQTLSQARDTLQGIRQLTEAATGNLKNMEKLTGTLGERAPDILSRLDENMQVMRIVLDEMSKLAQSVNQGQGTVGKLLNDPELYNRLNQSVANIQQITKQLQPIVSDVRVFTDKIARDPGQLGVKGILSNRQSGFKGNAAWRGTKRSGSW
ncbi:MAG: hypothetical protein CMJ81_00385 [Planctomycetaceae bacterium]|nr:hypothetical protein [Planctomycetaceae bacterium]MBP60962.1 hypothetical protein [Planctomycetaceae bacterium]